MEESKFLDKWDETIGVVIGQVTGGGGLLGGASAGVGGILGSLIPCAATESSDWCALLPVVTEEGRSMVSGVEETQGESY